MNTAIAPIVKWAGGKRQLLPILQQFIPSSFDAYYEPFLGGAAVLLALKPKVAIVNDSNCELMTAYRVIKDDVNALIDDLTCHQNNKEYYYHLRGLDRDPNSYATLSDVKKASRFLYLNKTCFNGLFRVNKSGQFNSPFGRYKKPNIINETRLRALNAYLNKANVTLLTGSFESALTKIKKDAFVYFDPPYDPVSETAKFTGYTATGFDREWQIRLKQLCDELNGSGIKFLLSNSPTPFIVELYKEYKIENINAKRNLNANADTRNMMGEVLIRNYE